MLLEMGSILIELFTQPIIIFIGAIILFPALIKKIL